MSSLSQLPTPSFFPGDTRLHALVSYGYSSDEAVARLLFAVSAQQGPAALAQAVDARNEAGQAPLHLAAQCAYFRGVELLLAHGADANAQSPSGMTALMWSSACGAINEVRLLLGAAPSSADLNARAIDGRTALLVAARSASVAGTGVVAALLRAGAGAEASERDEALRLACLHGHTEAVFELLEYGASANSRDAFGRSPLWLAACANHLDAVQRLLARGADPGSRDAFGRSPLDAAVRAAASH